MTRPSTQEITQLLLAWSEGDQIALGKLTPLVYAELHFNQEVKLWHVAKD